MAQSEQHIQYWLESAERSWSTAQDLLKTEHYDACLFFCHLSLEKLLKALAVKVIQEPAPYIHDLAKLAQIARLELTEKQLQQLRTITTFNISARYDEVKLAFYKQCTPENIQKSTLRFQRNYLYGSKKNSRKSKEGSRRIHRRA